MDDDCSTVSKNSAKLNQERDPKEDWLLESHNKVSGYKKKPIYTDEKKSKSAWILFVNDHREKVKLNNPDLSCSEQSKVLSQIWQQLDRNTVDKYIKQARERPIQHRLSPRYAYDIDMKVKDAAGDEDETNFAEKAVPYYRPASANTDYVCPMGRIRKIIKLDPEVGNVTKEATALIEKAMQLFLEELAKRSWELCTEDGRRNIKIRDIAMCIHSLDQYHWCKADFDKPTGF